MTAVLVRRSTPPDKVNVGRVESDGPVPVPVHFVRSPESTNVPPPLFTTFRLFSYSPVPPKSPAYVSVKPDPMFSVNVELFATNPTRTPDSSEARGCTRTT